MSYTVVRLRIQVRNSRRQIREFIRPEYATNTSSHAERFDTIDAAENAADRVKDHYEGAGHTYIGADFFEVA